ncbi:hypothetical protein H8486_002911 [Listeria monocytogenes]|nr:hypothetical protein [Listeria monocytogenes]EGC1215219.1 hypothetical protein [Listeria monocytogenes]EGX6726906.1 hypothetical protein [Listeria innocua]EGX6739288.1 hypothetical protein [Listeria innocua]
MKEVASFKKFKTLEDFNKAVSKHRDNNGDLNGTDRRVLRYLSQKASYKCGVVAMYRETIAKDCGISVKTVGRAIKKLKDLQILEVKRRANGKRQISPIYVFLPYREEAASLGELSESDLLQNEKNWSSLLESQGVSSSEVDTREDGSDLLRVLLLNGDEAYSHKGLEGVFDKSPKVLTKDPNTRNTKTENKENKKQRALRSKEFRDQNPVTVDKSTFIPKHTNTQEQSSIPVIQDWRQEFYRSQEANQIATSIFVNRLSEEEKQVITKDLYNGILESCRKHFKGNNSYAWEKYILGALDGYMKNWANQTIAKGGHRFIDEKQTAKDCLAWFKIAEAEEGKFLSSVKVNFDRLDVPKSVGRVWIDTFKDVI